MWKEMLLVESLFFWPIIVGIYLALSVVSFRREWKVLNACIILTLLVLALFTDFNTYHPLDWLWERRNYVGAIILSYIVIGALWGPGFRWNKFVKKRVTVYNQVRNAWIKKHDVELTSDGQFKQADKAAFTKYIVDEYRGEHTFYTGTYDSANPYKLSVVGSMSDYWDDVLGQAAWWPLDMPGYLFGEFLYDFWNWVCQRMRTVMNAIVRRHTRNISGDFE